LYRLAHRLFFTEDAFEKLCFSSRGNSQHQQYGKGKKLFHRTYKDIRGNGSGNFYWPEVFYSASVACKIAAKTLSAQSATKP